MNMNNNSQEKKKAVFNFIDVLLIVAFLAGALSLVYFLRDRKVVISDSGETEEIIYRLEISPMREEFRNLVSIGDTVTDAVSLLPIGEVTDVSYSACYYTGLDRTTGETVKSAYPGMITMTVTVKAQASPENGGYTVNGRDLILGTDFAFRVPAFTGTGKCISVSPASAEMKNERSAVQ